MRFSQDFWGMSIAFMMASTGACVDNHCVLYGTGGDLSKVSQSVIDRCYFYRMRESAVYSTKTDYGYEVPIGRARN